MKLMSNSNAVTHELLVSALWTNYTTTFKRLLDKLNITYTNFFKTVMVNPLQRYTVIGRIYDLLNGKYLCTGDIHERLGLCSLLTILTTDANASLAKPIANEDNELYSLLKTVNNRFNCFRGQPYTEIQRLIQYILNEKFDRIPMSGDLTEFYRVVDNVSVLTVIYLFIAILRYSVKLDDDISDIIYGDTHMKLSTKLCLGLKLITGKEK